MKKEKKKRHSFPSDVSSGSPLYANESISRFSLMYCDSYVPHVALPKTNPFQQRLEQQRKKLQRQAPLPPVQTKTVSEKPTQQQKQKHYPCRDDDYRFLLNVIFGLHHENKNKQQRIRKRLGGAGRIVCEQLWKKYVSCPNYGRILDRYCPLPQAYREVVASSHGLSPKFSKASETNNTNDRLAMLSHAFCPKEGIVSFLGSVLKKVFPKDFWGSEANFRSFLASVQSFVHLRCNEKLANKNLMQKISVTSMKWLYNSDAATAEPYVNNEAGNGNTGRTSRKENNFSDKIDTGKTENDKNDNRKTFTNHRKRKRKSGKQRTNHEAATELTLQALRWVFKGFIIPLLRSCFYVTETEFDARELHYYRRPVWALFRALSFDKLTTTTKTGVNQLKRHFKPLSHSQAKQSLLKQHMGVSKLRFLPKSTGMRPIAQLSRCARFEFPRLTKATSTTNPTSSDGFRSSIPKRPRIEKHPTPGSCPSKKQKVGNQASVGKYANGSSMESSTAMKSESPPPLLAISRLPTNTILENVLDVLTYECERRHRPFGNGLGNLRQFYVRYRDYMTRIRKQQPALPGGAGKIKPQFYFAKVDIEKCYDRIHQDYLLNLVQSLVLHNTYVVQTVKMDCANLIDTRGRGEDINSTSKIKNNAFRLKKIVETVENYRSFHHLEHPLSKKHRNIVFELLRCSLVEKPKVMELIKEHLQQHIVAVAGRHGEKLLLQSCGISQGSTLSMLLCNMYYGTVEKLMLGRNDGRMIKPSWSESSTMGAAEKVPPGKDKDGEADLISRFVDDFLFISPNEDSFLDFLDKAHKGKPDLGARINPSKTLVNADASITAQAEGGGTETITLTRSDRIMTNGRQLFPWCGLLFDTNTGEVMIDYKRFRCGKLRRSLTIDSDGSEGQKMAHRMRGFLFPRCLPILYDTSINSFATIAANFYQMMLFSACKTGEYIKDRNISMKQQLSSHKNNTNIYKIRNTDFLLRCIRGLAGHAIKNIQSQYKPPYSSLDEITRKIHRKQVFTMEPKIASALCLKAFFNVFSYFASFGIMTRLLRDESSVLMKGIPRKMREELRKIMAQAWDSFRIKSMVEM